MERNEDCFTLNTGARIPAVGLGTWQADGASCQAAVATALEVGYRHLDCAHLYGNENDVGQALSEALNGGVPGLKREDIFVTSKLWCTTNTPKRIGRAVEISLKNLGLQYLDLYLMHWPVFSPLGDATDPPSHRSDELLKPPPRRMEATWRAMEELVSKGLVRAIGLSNFNITQMEEILSYAKIVPAVNQVELHPFWRQDKLVQYCHSKGIHLSAHTPLGIPGGRASGPASSSEDAVESPAASIVYSRSRSVHAPMLKSHVVAEIAERLARTPAQVHILL
jgi:alcohol dehydrogenase (NADP+)